MFFNIHLKIMKKNYIFIILIILIIIGIILYFYFTNSKKNDNNFANAIKLSTEVNIINSINNDNSNTTFKEEELSNYSSPLKAKASGRLNNIRLTCERLNGKTIKSGETFSFCETLGPSTSEKGYEKADIIVDGKTKQDYGGGNCQVSSTIYNAVLAVDNLEVIERHEHGKDVGYVPIGKDATVAYGSLDFKFKNNSTNTIKMYCSSDDKNVTVKLVKLIPSY